MKMKTITIKGQKYKVSADATIAAPGWVTGVYYRAGKNWYFTDVNNKETALLGELINGPIGANLSESVYIGDGPNSKPNKVAAFSIAKLALSLSMLALSLAMLVGVIAAIAIDAIGL